MVVVSLSELMYPKRGTMQGCCSAGSATGQADEGCDFDCLQGREKMPEPEIH
jgi:hypothetical protein